MHYEKTNFYYGIHESILRSMYRCHAIEVHIKNYTFYHDKQYNRLNKVEHDIYRVYCQKLRELKDKHTQID